MVRLVLAALLGLVVQMSQEPSARAQDGFPPPLESVQIDTFAWSAPDGIEQLATVYTPKAGVTGAPMLVDVHGGAWGAYDRKADRIYAERLAAQGLVVMSIDFRQATDVQHPVSSAEIAAAVRYAKLNAERYGADPARVGTIGSSSGGHLVMLAGVRPNTSNHQGVPIADGAGRFVPRDDIDATPAFIVGMWPVSDPAARYRYAQRAGIDQLVTMTENYFGDEAAMWDASIPRIVTSGEADSLPPLLIVQPGADSNIPQEMTFDTMEAWQARGGYLEYAFFPGEKHAFGHYPTPATDRLVSLVADFVERQTRGPS